MYHFISCILNQLSEHHLLQPLPIAQAEIHHKNLKVSMGDRPLSGLQGALDSAALSFTSDGCLVHYKSRRALQIPQVFLLVPRREL